MKVNPHLAFDGECAAAFRFYERLFGGKIVTMLSYGDSPLASQFKTSLHQRILHATLELGDQTLYGADTPSDEYQRPQGFCVTVSMDDIESTQRIFAGFAAGGTVRMQLQETFWTAGFGLVTDRFGIPWEVQCEQPPLANRSPAPNA
jgi:PhnB protein